MSGLFAAPEVMCLRPSSLSLDDKGGLLPYAAATAVRGLLRHEDLMTQAALLDGEDWRAFKPLVRQIEDREGNREAGAGTTIHAVFGALVEGRSVKGVGSGFLKDAQACVDALDAEGIRVDMSEVGLVSLDAFSEPVAGSADGISSDLQIIDIKSTADGDSSRWRAVGWSIQLACYAAGKPYKGEFARDRWGRPLVDPDLVDDVAAPLNREVGIVVEVGRGSGKATVHRVDLIEGARLAQLAIDVRSGRKASVLL